MKTTESDYLLGLQRLYNDKIKLYQDKLKAIETLRIDDNSYSNDNTNTPDVSLKRLDVPNEYSHQFNQDFKVYFALRKIREGFVDDVANELVSLDQSFDFKKAKNLATQKLSSLNGNGYLQHKKIGNKYKYSVK